MRIVTTVAIALAIVAVNAVAEETAIVQDFETDFEINKWPGDKPGAVAFSTEWKSDGKRSMKIDAGLMTAIGTLKLADWTGYSVLRVHANNPTGQTVTVGFELQDQNTTYHERHQNEFGLLAGEHVIELDMAGGLWRGEQNAPYRGKIKTPIDIGHITRMSFTNNGPGPIFIDQIEVVKVKKLETPGGFAFQFAKSNSKVMNQFTFVSEKTAYDAQKGYGLAGGGSALGKGMSYPTPMLGNGVHWESGFRVNIPEGGAYIGWIAFERGGFWEDESSAYSHLTLKNNGAAVHEHDFDIAGMHFWFQDTDITDMSQLADKLIWPAHAINKFKFTAARGENTFTIEVKDPRGYPVRVAGLILAPDTAEGNAFIAAHEQNQRKTIETTFAAQDRGRRGKDRAEPAKNLVAEPLEPGEEVYPRDWPHAASGAPLGELLAVTGQTATIHLAVYAKKDLELTATAKELAGPGKLDAPIISHGRYMPMRPYGVGAVWLEVNHYRPEPKFSVGANVARSVIFEYTIPSDAKPGAYSGSISLTQSGGGNGEGLELPVKINVAAAKLADVPIPLGVFMNALAFDKSYVGEDTWWRLQESLLKEQGLAGLNTCTGGPGLEISIEDNGAKVSGADAVKFLQIAKKYGMNKAVVPYGGFLPHAKAINADPKLLSQTLKKFEEANQLPPIYVYSFDEPGTEDEKKAVMGPLKAATAGGLRTIGYTSENWADAMWVELIKSAYAPACNLHSADWFKKAKELGLHPWIYNNSRDRFGYSVNLWRDIKLGCEGRVDWIGVYTQGFAFHNLDGREPSDARFAIHKQLGVLKTPGWLGSREGLLDLRLRLALEKAAPAGDPVLSLWSADGYQKDTEKWTNAEMNKVRAAMIKRLGELAK